MPAPRECPCCGQLQRTGLHVQRFAPIAGRVTLNGYTVVSCDHCGMIFADGIPSQHELDEYYEHASKYAYAGSSGKESPSDAARLAATAAAIAGFCPDRSARILDVGAATGRLLHELKQLGYEHVSGEDHAQECGPIAAQLYGVTVRHPINGRSGEYDLITLVGVLEHVRDVRECIAWLAPHLTDGGQLYVEVPDVAGFASVNNVPYQELSPEHINFFSERSLRTTLEQCGLLVTSCTTATREQGPGVLSPTLIVTAARVGPWQDPQDPAAIARAGSFTADRDSAGKLHGYLLRSASDDHAMRRRLDHRLDTARWVIIWGVGALTRRLAADFVLSREEVIGFVDADPRVIGGKFLGHTIMAPAEAIGRTIEDPGTTILPLSRQHGDAIRAQIPAGITVARGVI